MNSLEEILRLYKSTDPIFIKGFDDGRVIDYKCTYEEYEKVLSNNLSLVSSISKDGLFALIKNLTDNESLPAKGLFFSALLNVSRLKEIDCEFNFSPIGFKLGVDKKLTILKGGPKCKSVGCFSEGEIFNHSFCEHLGYKSNSGVILNLNHADTFAREAKNGIQVNKDTCGSLAYAAEGGLQINLGRIGGCQDHEYGPRFAYCSKGGIQINYGSVESSFASSAEKGIQINFGKISGFYEDNDYGNGIVLFEGFGYRAKSVLINVGTAYVTEGYDNIINLGHMIYQDREGGWGDRSQKAIEGPGLIGNSDLHCLLKKLSKWDQLRNYGPNQARDFFKNLDYIQLEDDLRLAVENYKGAQKDFEKKSYLAKHGKYLNLDCKELYCRT